MFTDLLSSKNADGCRVARLAVDAHFRVRSPKEHLLLRSCMWSVTAIIVTIGIAPSYAQLSSPPYQTPVYTKPADDSVAFGSLLEASGYTNIANTDWVGVAAGNFCGGAEKQLIVAQNQAPNFSVLHGPAPWLPPGGGVASLGSSNANPWRAVAAGNLDNGPQDELVAVRSVTSTGVPDLIVAKLNGCSCGTTNCETPTIIATTSVGNASNSDWVGAAVGNFDGTGKKIALLKNAHSNLFLVNQQSLSVVYSTDLAVNSSWKAMAAGDVDGDGLDELIVARQVSDYSSPTVLVYKWDPHTAAFYIFASSTFGNDGNSDWSGVTAGDFNADGRQAIVLAKGAHSNFALLDFPSTSNELRILATDDLDSVAGQAWTGLAGVDWLGGDDGASELIAVRAVHDPQRTNIFVYGNSFHRVSRDTALEATKAEWDQAATRASSDVKAWLTAAHANTFMWWVAQPGDYTALVQFLNDTKGFAVDGQQLRVWLTFVGPKDADPAGSCPQPEATPSLTTWNALDFFAGDNTIVAQCRDMLAWAAVAGRLAQDFPQLVGIGIDDFSDQLGAFTPDLIAGMESNMRTRAPWLNFAPTVYYPKADWSAHWKDMVLSLDSMVFYFRNQKRGVCIGTSTCDSTVGNAPDEIADMSKFLPRGRKMLLGIYYVALWSEAAPYAGQLPTPLYDFELTQIALTQPAVSGTVAYALLSPTDCGSPTNFCALRDAYIDYPAAQPVPNIVGLPESSARNAILDSGLVVSTVFYDISIMPAGSVISQNPSAGTIEFVGSPVQFTVSSGGVIVPNVLSLPSSNATSAISAVNLVPSVSFFKACINPGDVLTQSPLSGTLVALGSTVHITVDSGTRQSCGVLK